MGIEGVCALSGFAKRNKNEQIDRKERIFFIGASFFGAGIVHHWGGMAAPPMKSVLNKAFHIRVLDYLFLKCSQKKKKKSCFAGCFPILLILKGLYYNPALRPQ
jgi:hypothetical protein